MKKILVALSLLALTGTSMAQHYHGFRHHGHHGHHRGPGIGWWVAPVVVGAIGYELGRQQVIVQPPPVVIQQQPVQASVTCTEWKEIQGLDGKIYRERTCTQ
jgi:hypothetical protein